MMDTLMLLNHPQPNNKPQETVASPFYSHPYGGIGRDITVSREGFMRFFEWDEFMMDFAEQFHGKVVDQTPRDWSELLGYHDHGKWVITVINRSHGALMDHAVRTTIQN
jgi:hypothetical protein